MAIITQPYHEYLTLLIKENKHILYQKHNILISIK